MAFRFKLNEPVEKGFRRIGLEQIERAERELTASESLEVATHETRKGLKRVRALLRLARPGLGDTVYRAENARFRDIGALLSSARDRDVLVETVTKLETVPGEVANAALAAVKKLILDEREGSHPGRSEGTREALERLAIAKKKFRRLKLEPDDFSTIAHGITESYRKGRQAFEAAYANGADEVFHEWRKAVQQHWRQMALISRAWPAFFEARVGAARALSQLLGDDHDLFLLVEYVRNLPPDRLSAMHVAEIERQARARQDELRKLAQPRGRQLFSEGAGGLGRRIRVIWEAGGKIAEHEGDAGTHAPAEGARPQASKLHG
jgi:CHAD domain-containing protein